ncbi:MAG TPA: (Fe-S)-binding protein [Polyangiaceae bacterium]|nr:(Fe-S)-binding protein [Polyangiaceae bacterium]
MAPHALPLLDRRQDELSKCAYCPKLCRATCVVSEIESREMLTPWGKMTTAFDAARGAELDADRAALAWGCSNCFKCREACDHKNPVTETLNDARADYVARGLAPSGVTALLERLPQVEQEHEQAAERLQSAPGARAEASHALLLGCRYAKEFPEQARAAIRLVARLVGDVRVLSGCCGAWQRAAGGAAAASSARAKLTQQLVGAKRLYVLDPRCALELAELEPVTLVELASRHLARFKSSSKPAPVRYHDSCALGRGLGLYAEPRRLLARVTGERPLELETHHEGARCSGGGGVLPVSMPAVAREAARRLADEHERAGGGVLVTSCASSLSQLLRAGVEAVDLVTLLERGLGDDV